MSYAYIAYPCTPSTEILKYVSCFKDVSAEWSTNEKVAMEVGLGACYAGARTMVSKKKVELNSSRIDPHRSTGSP